jgi:mevalonate kinase
MIQGSGRAPGKVILFGEHAVVYGRPALAVPVTQVQATATVERTLAGSGLTIWALDLDERIALATAPADQPLAAIIRLVLAKLGRADAVEPDCLISVQSTVPIASGLGSGAAVSTAIVRALAAAFARELSSAEICDLVYEVEKLYHGTPSGVDNTVVAYEQPVYFVRGQRPRPFAIGRPFTLIIADSGIASSTKVTVGDVRVRWLADPDEMNAYFDRIGAIVEDAAAAIAAGEPERLGPLMNANQALLVEIGVSCPALDALAAAAINAGASGAKLSGGGRGGNLIALADRENAEPIAAALRAAGATLTIITTVGEQAGD